MLSLTVSAYRPDQAAAVEAGVAFPGPEAVQPQALQTLGTHWVRMFLTWPDLEPEPGIYSAGWLANYEQKFRQLPAGTKVLLDVVGAPSWETGSGDPHAPPANPQDFGNFVGWLAQRFSPWVDAYEIWNEEDSPSWWTGAPEPARYTQLLQAAYPAIKGADPSATVLVGGLTGNDFEFLEGIYNAGGKGYFDAVAVHTDTACDVLSPYQFLREGSGRLVADSFLAYREVHQVMAAHGDGDLPIWMTELSWRTTSATCSEGAWAGQKPEGVSEEQQATYLSQAYHCLSQDPYVQVALWFPLEDDGSVVSGLEHEDGTHKPSFAAMRSFARKGDQLHEECGNFSGPKITVSSPSANFHYSGPLPIDVSASSKEGVFRIRLEWDGKLIRNYDGPSYPTTLSGEIEWQHAKHIPFGRHTLTILAYDKQRNVSETNISIVHVHPKRRKRHGRGRRHHRG